jgi:hypothetical protein
MMQALPQPTPNADPSPLNRHNSGWCRRVLGALWGGSQHHSYAICESCKQTYFAGLYDAPARSMAEPENSRVASARA